MSWKKRTRIIEKARSPSSAGICPSANSPPFCPAPFGGVWLERRDASSLLVLVEVEVVVCTEKPWLVAVVNDLTKRDAFQ